MREYLSRVFIIALVASCCSDSVSSSEARRISGVVTALEPARIVIRNQAFLYEFLRENVSLSVRDPKVGDLVEVRVPLKDQGRVEEPARYSSIKDEEKNAERNGRKGVIDDRAFLRG